MKKKNITFFIFVSIIIFGGCNAEKLNVSNTKNENIERSAQNVANPEETADDIVLRIDTNADKNKLYSTIESLTEDSEFGIRGTVLEKRSFVRETGVVKTIYKLKVSEVLFGEVQVNDILEFEEPGGIVPYLEYARHVDTEKSFETGQTLTAEEKKNGKVEYIWNGAPHTEINEEHIIFGRKETNENGVIYCSTGNEDGDFKVNQKNKIAKRHTIHKNNDKELATENLKTRIKKHIKKAKNKNK